MKKKVLTAFFAVLMFCSFVAQAQSPELERLLNEREKLIEEYKYYNSQNSNFWGKKSKNDLLNIIETLKKIINKDSEIVAAVRAENIKTKATQEVTQELSQIQDQGNKQMLLDRIYDLEREVTSLRNLNKTKERKVTDLQDRLKEVREQKYNHDRITTIVSVVAGLLLLYTIILHVKLSRRPVAKTRKKRK